MKTESDIPELFRQFSGNSANYQELTRAAAARASQARWPLLSAVELEQGDIPAVIDQETGATVLETKSLKVAGDAAVTSDQAVHHASAVPTMQPLAQEALHDNPQTVPFAVLTEVIAEAAPTTGEILAHASNEGVTLSNDEIQALTGAAPDAGLALEPDAAANLGTDISATTSTRIESAPAIAQRDSSDDFPQFPTPAPEPVVLPGTNTIFMAPAPFSARHFAQVERTIAARREAALAEIMNSTASDDVSASNDAAIEPPMGAAVTVPDTVPEAVAATTATQPAVVTPVSAPVPETPAVQVAAPIGSASLDNAQSVAVPEIVAPVAAAQVAAAAVAVAPAVVSTTLAAATVATPAVTASVMDAPAVTRSRITAPAVTAPIVTAPATPAVPPHRPAPTLALRPTSTPSTAPVLTPAPAPRAVAPVPLAAKPQPSVVATETSTNHADAAVKHAGLKPLFDRLAAPEETETPVMTLFSRLLKS